MTTLAIMKSRIALELRRDDLTADIANAITTAIDAYSHKHTFANENDAIAFDTVVAQDSYSSADNAELGNLLKIDYVFLMVGASPYQLDRKGIAEIKDLNLWTPFQGQPIHYCWYSQKLWLSPIPNLEYGVKVGGVTKKAAPASDGETGNFWMTDVERLIRCRAKAEVYAHVIKDMDKATVYGSLASEALAQLEDKTSTLESDGIVEPVPFW